MGLPLNTQEVREAAGTRGNVKLLTSPAAAQSLVAWIVVEDVNLSWIGMCLPCVYHANLFHVLWQGGLENCLFFIFLPSQLTIENGCNALARYGKFVLKSNQSKHAWNIKHWDCFFPSNMEELSYTNGNWHQTMDIFYTYIYICVCVWVWVCMGIMVP